MVAQVDTNKEARGFNQASDNPHKISVLLRGVLAKRLYTRDRQILSSPAHLQRGTTHYCHTPRESAQTGMNPSCVGFRVDIGDASIAGAAKLQPSPGSRVSLPGHPNQRHNLSFSLDLSLLCALAPSTAHRRGARGCNITKCMGTIQYRTRVPGLLIFSVLCCCAAVHRADRASLVLL